MCNCDVVVVCNMLGVRGCFLPYSFERRGDSFPGGVRVVKIFTQAFCGGQFLSFVQGTIPLSSTWPVRFKEVGFRVFTDHWKEIRICCRGLLEKARSQTGAPSLPVGLLKRARPRQGAFIAQDRSLTRARPQVGAPGILFSPLCHCL